MNEKIISEENFLGGESTGCRIEDIQEKTSFYLSKLFDYFGEEEGKNIS